MSGFEEVLVNDKERFIFRVFENYYMISETGDGRFLVTSFTYNNLGHMVVNKITLERDAITRLEVRDKIRNKTIVWFQQ